MGHFAKIENGIVTSVMVVPSERDADGETYLRSLGFDGDWVQTSYNTRGNVHYGPDGEPDGGVALRYNYAGVGFTYDPVRDAFIAPEPAPTDEGTWVLDEATLLWTFIPNEEL